MVKAQIAIASLRDAARSLPIIATSIAKFIWTEDFLFPASMWFLSRLLVGISMLLIAPNLPPLPDGITPNFGWGIFDTWDSGHYR
ncbi:MAG: hypothetical protein ACKPGB_09850, partial [Dolichospermum sp.]